MKKKIRLIVLTLIFLLGFVILILPKITNYLYEKKVGTLVNNFEENIGKLSDDKEQKLSLLYELLKTNNNDIYNSKQETFVNQKVSYEKSLIDLTQYDLEDGIIGFIEIPSINVKLPIYLGANNNNMNLGAVHLTGTSYPIGGINTNSVIAAHRGWYKSNMFRYINKIAIDDSLYIKNFKEVLEYKAVRINIIKPTELNELSIVEGKDMVTIFSCHPIPSSHLRYVVYFERVY